MNRNPLCLGTQAAEEQERAPVAPGPLSLGPTGSGSALGELVAWEEPPGSEPGRAVRAPHRRGCRLRRGGNGGVSLGCEGEAAEEGGLGVWVVEMGLRSEQAVTAEVIQKLNLKMFRENELKTCFQLHWSHSGRTETIL